MERAILAAERFFVLNPDAKEFRLGVLSANRMTVRVVRKGRVREDVYDSDRAVLKTWMEAIHG
jgi:hypothetical protein